MYMFCFVQCVRSIFSVLMVLHLPSSFWYL